MSYRVSLTLIVLLALCGYYAERLRAQDAPAWRHRGRLQIGIEHDDNIKEAPQDPVAARSMRFMFHYSGKRLSSSGTRISLEYQGGYQSYWEHADEHKLINELDLNAAHRVNRSWQLGLQGRGRFKIFLNDEIDYSFGYASGYSDFVLFWDLKARISAAYEYLNYANSRLYDFSDNGYTFTLLRSLMRRCTISVILAHHRKKFERSAYSYDAELASWTSTAPYQIDKMTSGGLQIEVRTKILLTLIYTYQTNNSNSYGFGYGRHRLQALFGARLPGAVLLRIFAAIQQKKYVDDLAPIFPLELDTEREESNFLVVDLSRRLFNGITGIVRTAWHDNESPMRTLYYNKFTVSFSLEYAF